MKSHKRIFAKFQKEENGAVMVIVAFALIVIFGFAAFAVDFGLAYNSKANLQTAADAAALAGAQDLPHASIATSTAYTYADANGCSQDQTTIITPYNGDSSMIEVICSDTVEYYFAQVLGINNTAITARAVAQNQSQWDGDALPFINLDDDYITSSQIKIWDKTDQGDFESISSSDFEIINGDDPDTCYFKVDYTDGIVLKKGQVANIKQEIGYIYDYVHPNQPIYILSLTSEVINSGNVQLANGSTKSLDKLKNGDNIDPSQLVLVECLFDDYNYNSKTLELTVLTSYDIMNGEYPPTYSGFGGSVTMIE
jgi:hypothetical protein